MESTAEEKKCYKELRASWVATVFNLDWPSASSVKIAEDKRRIEIQKKELIRILDKIKEVGMNTIIFQVKPCADALYRSAILPWSSYLTGILGKDPGFDPLEYVLEQAHARGIALHAWLNPYRVSIDTCQQTMDELQNSFPGSLPSVYKQHRDWIGTAAHRFVLDPGIPAVHQWLEAIIEEIVSQYDIDGVQFDDYFYYESSDSKLDDANTYVQYGSGFNHKADWRRNNTYVLIKALSRKIKAVKPTVQFGISPAGVWRNKQDDLQGSDTQVGNPNYDTAYADTRRWVLEGLINYIAPQIYWPFARKVAPYDVIAKWWADTVRGTNTKLYIGMALYKIGVKNQVEPDWAVNDGVPEIARQLDLNESIPEIKGCMLFRQLYLWDPQTQPAIKFIKERWNQSALVPPFSGGVTSTMG